MDGFNSVQQNIAAFTRKYYWNLAIRGTLLSLTILLGYFLLIALLESALWMPGSARLLVFIAFFGIATYCILRFLREPLRWWIQKRGMSVEQSAQLIGHRFPTIGDRLLNVLQLHRQPQPSALWAASIDQKSQQFQGIPFDQAIDLRDNLHYVKFLSIPILALLFLLIFNRQLLTQSTYRIVRFQEEFSPAAPFQFTVDESKLTAFFNEDFLLRTALTGDALPEAVYIVTGNQRFKMTPVAGAYEYVFERVQAGFSFQLEGSGFLSKTFTLELIYRPELTRLKAQLEFPRYLGKAPATLQNAGNLEVPEGTQITWTVDALNATQAGILFASDGEQNQMLLVDNQSFNFSRSVRNPDEYEIRLSNTQTQNKDELRYSIAVLKDEFPTISLQQQKDSSLFRTLWLGGYASDDYGVSEMRVNYQIFRGMREETGSFELPVNPGFPEQRIFHTWVLDSLRLKPGDQLTYYVRVWDNDGVNGRKASQSATFRLALPSQAALEKEIERGTQNTQEKFQQSVKKSEEIKRGLEEAIQKLKGKQNLDWQDKQMLQTLLEERKKLDQQLDQLRKDARELEEKKDEFTEESERLQEKSEEVQKRLDELMDEEQRKLLEELEKLLKDNAPSQQLMKLLEQMQRKERDFKKEMERAQELYKQLQYEYKLEQTTEKLQEKIDAQEELLKNTEALSPEEKTGRESKKQSGEQSKKDSEKSGAEKPGESSPEKTPEELAQEQEELKSSLDELKKDVAELEEMGEDVEEPAELPSEQQMDDIANDQQQSQESLEQGKPQKAAQQQKQAVQKMKQMKNQMQGALDNMQMEMDMQNLESLRQIIHGLVKLSFDQENITKEFLPIQQTDPAYVELSQRQLKLKDDAKVLEDSLLSLSKRDARMSAIVTKEVGKLNDHVDKAVEFVRDRKKGNAGSEMQFAMTSINNLALLLNDHFDAMMQMMQNAMMMPGKGKPKKGQKMPGLGEKQRELNRRTEELMKGEKPGREMSEELARLAMEQEAIRRMLQEMQEGLKKNGQKPGGDLPGKMEETEIDLINKRLTNQLLQRQREILTRLLETEKSMREQNMDEERKGETAREYENALPRSFEQYLRLKEKELELLKTVPPKLYPYYKQEVSEYFKRLGNN
jgi:hypothetical protein